MRRGSRRTALNPKACTLHPDTRVYEPQIRALHFTFLHPETLTPNPQGEYNPYAQKFETLRAGLEEGCTVTFDGAVQTRLLLYVLKGP